MTNVLKRNNNFFGSVLTVLSGTTFSQLLPIAVSPILTRIYSPSEFGEFGLFIGILGIISVVATGRYELAIALPKEDKEAINILAVSIIFTFLFSLLLTAIIPFFYFFEDIFIIDPRLSSWLWMLPLGVLFLGIYQAAINWAIRTKNFKVIALTQFNRSSAIVIFQMVLGSFYAGAISLIISQIVGQLIALFQIFKRLFKNFENLLKEISWARLVEALVNYRKFPIFYSWSALLNTASVQLPLIMLAFYFNPVIVGFYTLANRVLAVPISTIGTAIAQPFLQRASEEKQRNNLGPFTLNIFTLLVGIGLIPLLIIGIVAPDIFMVVFGEDWKQAGVYVQLISIWLLFVFISSPLTHLFTILELQKESLFFNIVIFLSRILVLVIGGLSGSELFTIGLFGTTGALLWFIQIVWLLKKVDIHPTITMKVLIVELFKGLPFIAALLLFGYLINSSLIMVGISLLILGSFSLLKYSQIKRININ